MENLQHTPGPWRGEGRLVFAGTHSVAIAQYSGIQSENSESFANARLIAAAPELLEALKHCLSLIEGRGDFEARMACYNANAAVAKATSQTPDGAK